MVQSLPRPPDLVNLLPLCSPVRLVVPLWVAILVLLLKVVPQREVLL